MKVLNIDEEKCHLTDLAIDLGLVRTPPRTEKIRAFFGDEAPSHYLLSLTADTKPWYLRPNYDPAEVLIDPDGTVRGGTVPALVERLTAHEYSGTSVFTDEKKSVMETWKQTQISAELF